MITRLIILFACAITATSAMAQSVMLPLNQAYDDYWESWYTDEGDGRLPQHTGVKPLTITRKGQEYLLTVQQESRFKRKQYKAWAWRKLFNEHLIRFDTAGFIFNLDPVVQFESGQDSESSQDLSYFQNTRGFRLDGNVGKALYFQSSFYENQSVLPDWVDSVVNVTRVVPGSGRVKIFKEDGWDYSMASGVLSLDVTDFLQVQGGHGKHFIGEGYRSLLLSDNSFNYPFLRVQTTFGGEKFRLTNIWASLQSLDRIPQPSTPEALFQRKAATFHHLSWQPLNWLGIGLFESIQWQRWDSTGTQPYNPAIANPVLGLGTAIYGLNDVNNAVIGIEFKARIGHRYLFYGQFMMDDAGETGDQQGVKLYDVLGLRDFNLRLERNQVRAGALNHRLPLQNYGHYAQPLGHPLGSNFQELVVMADYRWRSWFVQGRYITADMGLEGDGQTTSRNIFLPEAAFQSGERVGGLDFLNVQLGYIIHPRTNVRALIGMTQRMEKKEFGEDRNQYIYVGLRTSLTNAYYDF